MQESKNSNAFHWILGAALLLIGLFVVIALVNMRSQADGSVVSTANISNATPTLSNIRISSVQYSSAATLTPVVYSDSYSPPTWYVTGSITDANGYLDVTPSATNTGASLTVVLFRTDLGIGTCGVSGDEDADCKYEYKKTTAGDCSVAQNAETVASFSCPFASIPFYTTGTVGGANNGTNWTVGVAAYDEAGASVANTSTTFEVTTQTALGVPSTFTHGNGSSGLALGTETGVTTNTEVTISQWSNTAQDLELTGSGTNLSCTTLSGSFPIGNQRFVTSDLAYSTSNGLALTAAAQDSNINVLAMSNATTTTRTLYWNIKVPSTGVAGTCTNTITATSKIAD